jgi:hypothetical protein
LERVRPELTCQVSEERTRSNRAARPEIARPQ